MKELFFELFSEEIPATLQLQAAEMLKELFIEEIVTLITYDNVLTFVTPRRLTLYAKLEEKTKVISEETRGPKTKADEIMIKKFLESKKITIEDCYKKITDSGEYWFYKKTIPSMSTETILQNVIENIICKFKWPKTMRWNNVNIKWIRPLRSIFCCFNNKYLQLNINGIESHNIIQPHRTLGTPFSVDNFKEYKQKLFENGVILDQNERKQEILKQIQTLEAKHSVHIQTNEKLLNEVNGLVEFPNVVTGKIDENFLKLPEKVIINCLINHQKIFPVFNSHNKLTSMFISVCNNSCTDNFIQGNEKVLTARLSDAEFFFKRDTSSPIDLHLEKAKNAAFYEGLGTNHDRTNRIKIVAKVLSDFLKLDPEKASKTASLMKFDLATEMVREFPELQGYIGSKYAEIYGESKEIVEAIAEQYMPIGSEAETPETAYGIMAALSDKIELLLSFFSIGHKLHGSKDPFGIRRAGIGILKILIDRNIHFDFNELLEKIINQLNYANHKDYFLQFLQDRLTQLMKCNPNLINAIIKGDNDFDIVSIFEIATTLKPFCEDSYVISTYKRLSNTIAEQNFCKIETALFESDIEHELLASIFYTQSQTTINGYTDKMLVLCKKSNNFLDNILCNVENSAIKNNRIAIISTILQLFEKYIKFSLLF